MVDIQHKGIIDRMDRDTRIQPSMALPRKLRNDIQPVLQVNPQAEIKVISDAIANVNDKTFTVPKGKAWKILYGFITLTTTADVGNRRIAVSVRDENNNILYDIRSLNVQIASTTENYALGQFGENVETLAQRHLLPIPVNLILDSGFDINIADPGDIEDADDMIVRFVVEETDTEGA